MQFVKGRRTVVGSQFTNLAPVAPAPLVPHAPTSKPPEFQLFLDHLSRFNEELASLQIPCTHDSNTQRIRISQQMALQACQRLATLIRLTIPTIPDIQ